MHKFRNAVLVASMTALALSALAVPAAAAGKGTLGIVNGIPGQKVDICVNGKEIRSKAPYGGKVSKVTSAGDKTIKIFKKDPRTCRGTKLAQKTYPLADGDDFTIVVNKVNPKWMRFDNKDPWFLGSIYPVGVESTSLYAAVRHAADLGTVAMRASYEEFWYPDAEDPWVERDTFVWEEPNPDPLYNWAFSASRLDQPGSFVSSSRAYMKPGRRYEFILLGTKPSNAKFIVWSRPVTAIP